MAKILSTAQKTFVDLYDSYVLNMDSDIVSYPCDQYGVASEKYTTRISFSASVGTKEVGVKCELVSERPSGLAVTINASNVAITTTQGLNLDDGFKLFFKFTTTDSNAFVFEKYVTFIKIKSGEKVVTFKIYSTDGDTFKEGLEKITMKTMAFDGLTEITSATYSWSYYDLDNNNWVSLDDEADSSLVVLKENSYSNSVIKCVMTYNDATYDDYFTLKHFNNTYDAVVKFFDGSNIFDASEPFIVAYVELYKNQQEEEMLRTPYYYYHTGNTYDASTNKHTFNGSSINSSYEVNGTLVYMIYKVVNSTDNNAAKYKVRLYRYNNGWASASATTYANNYVYKNDLYTELFDDVTTNIVVISKEDVAKARDVNFIVYTKALDDNDNYVYDNDLIVARANATVIDLNDPVISATEPSDPKNGQLWLNTSNTPYTLYIYENGAWVYFTQQNGKTVYTSRPSSYSEGDLWILAAGETCGEFREGSMLRANQSSSTLIASHWGDAMEDFTVLKNNIEQYFRFNADTGLKIGQTDDKFYVNISSTEMGFYDNSTGQNKKVVSISNNAATIKNLTIEGQAEFDCNATFNKQVDFFGFIWQKESNGSLSLAISD